MASTAVVFDILARDRASDKFDRLGRAADDSSGRMSKFNGVMKNAGKAAVLGLGAGLVAGAAALAGMTKNAIEDEAAQRRLATGLRNSVGATNEQIAAVEDWISKVGVAKGVTDDELRPAFQRLVQATGDVDEAQRQLNIAMDVSEGTGKSLKTVTEAMMKANNGSTASLAKLGLKTKNAKGETLTFKDALKSMADTFKGQASKHAQSFEGKVDRLKLIFDETKEAIGARLIPMLSDLGGWILEKGIPRFVHLKDKAKAFLEIAWDRLQPAIDKAKELGEKVKGLVGFFRDLKDMDPGEVGEKIGSAFSSALDQLVSLSGTVYEKLKSAFANVDWVGLGITIGKYVPALVLGLATGILNFDFGSVLSGIKQHWGEILLAVLAIAFAPAKIAGGLAKILARIPFVGKFLAAAVTWLNNLGGRMKSFGSDLMKTFWASFTGAIGKVPGGTIVSKILGVLRNIPGAVGDFFATLATRIGVWALNAFDKMGTSAGRKVEALLKIARGIPGKVISAVGNLGKTLYNAGVSLIQGLISGVTDKAKELFSLLSSIGSKVAGAFSHFPHPRAIGPRGGKGTPFEAFGGGSSIFGTDLSVEEGSPAKTVADILKAGEQSKLTAQQVLADTTTLIGKGLSDTLLKQLQEAGVEGAEQIHLLATATTAEIAQANAAEAARLKALKDAGFAIGTELSGVNDPKKPGGTFKQKDKDDLVKAFRTALDGVVWKVDGRQLRATLERDSRLSGTR